MAATEPVTELDPRFSDPDASATSWADVRQVIDEAELFWISTVRPDGRPHVTPLPAVWCDGALYFCTGAGEQKGVNLATERELRADDREQHLEVGTRRGDRGKCAADHRRSPPAPAR